MSIGAAVPMCHAAQSYSIANIFSAYLYGALTVQLYRYYISFPKDPTPFKVVIYTVYVTETICTALLVYHLSVMIAAPPAQCYDSPVIYDLTPPLPQIIAICGGIVAFLTQAMYAYRIQIITELKYVSWVIFLVITLQLFAIVTTSFLFSWTVLFMIVWVSVSLVVDVTIASSMVWFLKKDEIYSKQLKRKIARLIYLTIGTDLLTAATNLCVLVLSFQLKNFEYAFGLLIVLSKLYANSMMVLVNSRIPSARSETNRRATLDMKTVQLSSIRVTPQAAADREDGEREILIDPEARSVGLPAHEAEDMPNSDVLGSLTVDSQNEAHCKDNDNHVVLGS